MYTIFKSFLPENISIIIKSDKAPQLFQILIDQVMFLKFICGKLIKKLVYKFQGGHMRVVTLVSVSFIKGTCITK